MPLRLSLSLDSYTLNSATELQVVDNTGLTLTSADSSYKWGDEIVRSTVTSATIDIILPNGSDLFTSPMDVTTEIRGASTLIDVPFSIIDPSGDKFEDGIYEITYTVRSSSEIQPYIYNKKFTITANARCCVDKLWAGLPSEMCNVCDYEEYLDQCLLAEGYYNALNAASCCGDETAFDNILDLLTDICENNSCNC